MTGPDAFEAFVDERGTLVPIELDRTAFPPRRVFVVAAPLAGATRGGHEVTCREQLVLVAGRVQVRIDDRTEVLEHPGASVLIEPGQTMSYDLAPGGSTVVVLADEPWTGPRP
jgi:hypothetical protein